MIRLKIEKKENQTYFLRDEQSKEYSLNFEFFDIEKEPEVNDYIHLSAELLNPRYKEYTTYFSFGNLDNICGRADASIGDIDVIKVEMADKEIYLKRLYG